MNRLGNGERVMLSKHDYARTTDLFPRMALSKTGAVRDFYF
jgi:hypothetical protein